jgi:hypothetical protein
MKTYIILFPLLLNFSMLFGQKTYNDEFQNIYEKIAFSKGHNPGNKLVIKKWNQDIKIFFEGDSLDYLKLAMDSLIQKLSPCINKLRISVVSKLADANYLIRVIDTSGSYYEQPGYYENWTSGSNIYKCTLIINRNTAFNRLEQITSLRSFFISSLGYFTFVEVDYPVNSCMYDQFSDVTDFDCKVLNLHYSENIRSGMSKKDVKIFFRKNN